MIKNSTSLIPRLNNSKAREPKLFHNHQVQHNCNSKKRTYIVKEILRNFLSNNLNNSNASPQKNQVI